MKEFPARNNSGISEKGFLAPKKVRERLFLIFRHYYASYICDLGRETALRPDCTSEGRLGGTALDMFENPSAMPLSAIVNKQRQKVMAVRSTTKSTPRFLCVE